ncbi:MAG: PDZ domain-containing protein [Gemmataceae bacterium]
MLLEALTAAALVAAADKPAVVGVQIRLTADEAAVVVIATLADSPAQKAGIRPGDVLLRVGGLAPRDLRSAVEAIRSLKPNREVTFRVRRDGKEKEIDVTPAEGG